MKILLNIKIESPLPRQRGFKYLLDLGAGGGRGWESSAPPMGAQVLGGHRSAPTEPADEKAPL